MNKLTNEMNSGFPEYIKDVSKPLRICECRRCGSIEIHNPSFFSIHEKPCMGGCGFGTKGKIPRYTKEDKVPLTIRCGNCGNQKGFNHIEKSGVSEEEVRNHEMLEQAKSTMIVPLEDEDPSWKQFEESKRIKILAEDPQWKQFEESWAKDAKNKPKIKGNIEPQIFTIEPEEGFGSSGNVEKDLSHKGDIHETCYAPHVNGGNTPHMQKKKPISELIAVLDSVAKMRINLWQPKTYGSRKTYNDCEAEIGFTPEAGNRGNRKLSDQQINRMLDNITFASKDKMKLATKLEEHLLYLKESNGTIGKYAENLIEKMDELDEKIARNKGAIYTGNASCGHQSPMYDIKINTYDQVDLNKLAMELDIPWTESVLDIHELAKRVKQENAEAWRYNYVM